MDKEYYNYQCVSCACTLFADALPEGKAYTYIINGSCCSDCQSQQQSSYYDDDD